MFFQPTDLSYCLQGDDVIVTVPKTPKKRTPVGKNCDTCDKRTFVIVGAGGAGATAAEALRQDGFKVCD